MIIIYENMLRVRNSTLALPGAYIMNIIRYMDSMAHPMELMVISIIARFFKYP